MNDLKNIIKSYKTASTSASLKSLILIGLEKETNQHITFEITEHPL